eukprot:5955908-Amphidinium_carterae.2
MAERTTEQKVGVEYQKARQAHLASWSTALIARDVDTIWELWCRASEQALGLPARSRGRLLLGHRQLLEKVPDEEAVATAQQQDTVTDLKRKLLDTGACTFFEWPQFLGVLPPTLEAQYNFLDAWLTGSKKKIQAERTASWKAYVKDMWERSPRIRGTAAVCVEQALATGLFSFLLENRRSARRKPQAGIFLDCSKCYERVPLRTLEQFALESGRRWVLLQGAVSDPVTATHGMPPGCGHAVDLLHAFLLKTLQSAGRHASVRTYVDDMVLVASGPCFAGHLCYGYRQVHN